MFPCRCSAGDGGGKGRGLRDAIDLRNLCPRRHEAACLRRALNDAGGGLGVYVMILVLFLVAMLCKAFSDVFLSEWIKRGQ